jgi:hypothetical protein
MKESVMTKQTLNLIMDTRELAHNSHSWNNDDDSITLTKKYAKNLFTNSLIWFDLIAKVTEFYKIHGTHCIKISDDKFPFGRYAYSKIPKF